MDENRYASESLLSHVLARIRQQDYRGALQLLQHSSAQATGGESEALKGNALFMLQEYEQAEQAYEAALRLQPNNDVWQDMRDKAHRNAIARIDLHVPHNYYSQQVQPQPVCRLPWLQGAFGGRNDSGARLAPLWVLPLHW
jgi:tetratricopeptide (TPR) repeat protein